MKLLKVVSIMAFVIALFVTIDLGINLLGSFITEAEAGIPYNSVLQSLFGLLENKLRTRADFFQAFRLSLWLTYLLFIENIVVYIVANKIIKTKR